MATPWRTQVISPLRTSTHQYHPSMQVWRNFIKQWMRSILSAQELANGRTDGRTPYHNTTLRAYNKRELHWLYVCRILQMYFETWKYMFWGARSRISHINYKFFFWPAANPGAPPRRKVSLPPPPPNTKRLATLLPIPTEVITFPPPPPPGPFFFFFFCLLVRLFRRNMRTHFRWGFLLAGVGVGLVTSKF